MHLLLKKMYLSLFFFCIRGLFNENDVEEKVCGNQTHSFKLTYSILQIYENKIWKLNLELTAMS